MEDEGIVLRSPDEIYKSSPVQSSSVSMHADAPIAGQLLEGGRILKWLKNVAVLHFADDRRQGSERLEDGIGLGGMSREAYKNILMAYIDGTY
jgi:hypothetical protein